MDLDNFPTGKICSRSAGSSIGINGLRILITKSISEKPQPNMNERWAVFEGQTKTNQVVILKIRYQLNPSIVGEEELPSVLRFGKETFDDECAALRECQVSGHTPRLIDSLETIQESTDNFPTGYARIIVMSRVPGECALKILPSLTPQDKGVIRERLAELLEYIRLRGWIFYEQETEQVYYDKQTQKVYLIGFCRALREDFPPEEGEVITPDSIDVSGFGLGWG